MSETIEGKSKQLLENFKSGKKKKLNTMPVSWLRMERIPQLFLNSALLESSA